MSTQVKISEIRLKGRYRVLLVFFAFCFAVLSVRLFVLQVIKHEHYLQKAKDNIESKTALKAERGIIYDRNMIALATNITTWRIYITPRDIQNEEQARAVAYGLSALVGADYEKVLKSATNKTERDRTVKKKASEKEKELVLDYIVNNNLSHCVHIEASNERYYPYGELCAHVIGFVGTDGGLLGIEAYYDAYLKGEDGVYITEKNAQGQSLPNSKDTYIKAIDGNDVILSIDITLQTMLEARLRETYIDSKAQNRVTGVVMDPCTGEVLAMATYPSFDLNQPYQLNEFYTEKLSKYGYEIGSEDYKKQHNTFLYEMWNNKAVSTLYEPGSTFKIITTAVALEEGVSTETEGFHCSGALKIDGYGTPIRCHKRTGHGSLNFAEALQKSCNPTMIKLAQRIGNTKFMEYFKSFGYTEKSGIDLPGEALGIFHKEKDFNNVELSVYAFGQTFKTTAINQLSAISAVANGGELITPFLVKQIREKSGNIVYSNSKVVKKQVISNTTCDKITKILTEGVAGDGGAKNAAVAGYDVAAKTGTSQKRDIKDANLYVGSCVAYAVSEKASVSVIIAVDEPNCANYYGSTVGAPYVAAFLSTALPYLGVEASLSEEQSATQSITVNQYVGMALSDARNDIDKLQLKVTVIGNGKNVVAQSPAYSSKINKENGRIILYTDGEVASVVKVPKVVGLSATEAIKILVDGGFNIHLMGATDYQRGVGATVIEQSIAAGSEVPIGTSVGLILRYLDFKE